MSMKNPLTPAGIEPATFLFVAQHVFKSISINFGLVKIFLEIAPDMTDVFHAHVI